METNVENIYAAGDIAEYDNQVTGLWNIAIAQGRVAGYNIAGRETSIRKNNSSNNFKCFWNFTVFYGKHR